MLSEKISDSYRDELIAFAAANPWRPTWSSETIGRFLSGLISSPAMIIDVTRDGRRCGAAILLDKISNAGNHAAFEVLGIAAGPDAPDILSEMIETAWQRLPAGRVGFQVAVAEPVPMPPSWFAERGLKPGYEMFDMICEPVVAREVGSPENIAAASIADDREVYGVMQESFRDNIDINIPPFDDWHAGNKFLPQRSFLYRSEGAVQGFIRFSANAEGAEIGTLGVLPAARRGGIGRALLLHSLQALAGEGVTSCKLSVAGKNASALTLYEDAGFTVMGQQTVFIGER